MDIFERNFSKIKNNVVRGVIEGDFNNIVGTINYSAPNKDKHGKSKMYNYKNVCKFCKYPHGKDIVYMAELYSEFGYYKLKKNKK